MPKDYLAAFMVKKSDLLQHGVKGQRWGIRRTEAQLARARTEGDSDPPSATKPAAAESSQARYARLSVQAKTQGASSLSDDDLKFFNARTEAIKKVAQMNQKNPNWIRETAQTVIRKTAQESIQSISNAVVNQYVTKPIIQAAGAQSPPKKPKNKN